MATASRASSQTLPKFGFRLYRALQWVIIIGVLFGVFWGWKFLKNPAEFPIKSVKVQASYQHINPQTIQQIVLPFVNRSFFNVDINGLKQSLLQLPWVEDVKVQRVLPDTLVIKVVERQPVARFENALINANGQIFIPPANTFPQNLPILKGKEDKIPKLWQYYQALNPVLTPLKLAIHELEINNRQSVSLVLTNGTLVFLGNTQVLPRLHRFVKVYPQIFANPAAHADSVDLRYENGLTVKWRH